MDKDAMLRRLHQWERDVLGPALTSEQMRDPGLFTLDSGPEAQLVYTPLDLAERGIDEWRDIGLPGEFPFTRGIHPAGARGQPPLIKMYSGLGSPEDTNRRYKQLLEWGAEEIHMAVDLPSQIGYDADHVMASGEVGRAGVSICSIRDMDAVFDGLPMNSFRRIGMLGNCTGPIALALFVVLGERQGLSVGDYVVDLQNDPLKEYVARGTQFLPIRPAVRLAADVVAWCAKNAPHWYPMDACANHLNAAGAGSSQATAFALANAICYVEALLAQGLRIDEFAPMLQMFLDEREEFFAQIANIRATRRIWATLMKERFGAQNPRSMALQVTAYGHGRETRVEPLNNVVRVAFASLAYYLAGVQTLYDASFDEVLAIPSAEAALIAVRTQQIINHEHGFSFSADPLGGSYLVEALTTDLERRIRSALAEVDRRGGAIACIENGFMKNVIMQGAVRRQQRFEDGTRVMVGVNRFVCDEPPQVRVPVTRIDQAVEEVRHGRLAHLRGDRDNARVGAALAAVGDAARGTDNVVPPVIEAVRAEATLGEICDVFRAVFGEWQPDRAF